MAIILMVDDDEFVIELARFGLEALGHTVMSASDGSSALDIMKQSKPDLLIVDAMMPVMDGFEVLYEIRNNLDMGDLPVVMLTARKGEADVVNALRSGASDYVTKPFSPNELIARVEVLLARHDNSADRS